MPSQAADGEQDEELEKLKQAGRFIRQAGMALHAGHGLTYHNVRPVATIEGMHELNIGHSIVSRALMVGFQQAVREMKRLGGRIKMKHMRSSAVLLLVLVFTQALAADSPPKDLLAGTKPQFCLAAESQPAWKEAIPKDGGPVRARWVFSVPESNSWASATLQSSQSVESCVVNGTRVPPPVKGMRYATLAGHFAKIVQGRRAELAGN